MTPAEAYAQFEHILARAITADDPVASLSAAAEQEGLPADLADTLRRVDEDGLRRAALRVARLRLQRLLQGSAEAAEWQVRDPDELRAVFRRYHAEVPPTAFFPEEEARLFERFVLHSARERGAS